jgi:hypothetical protein
MTNPDGPSDAQRIDQMNRVNEPIRIQLRLSGRVDARDRERITEALSFIGRLHSRENGTHAAVTQVLLKWLSDATGQQQSELLTKLAAYMDSIPYAGARLPTALIELVD